MSQPAQPHHPLLRGALWMNGPAPLRHTPGPYPGALISLNLLAALFSHAHSDASMRILHGYSSIGLIPGLLTCGLAVRLVLRDRRFVRLGVAVIWFLINSLLLGVNTWIAFQGMGIPNGNLFHLALGAAIAINLRLAWRIKQRPVSFEKVSGRDLWTSP